MDFIKEVLNNMLQLLGAMIALILIPIICLGVPYVGIVLVIHLFGETVLAAIIGIMWSFFSLALIGTLWDKLSGDN